MSLIANMLIVGTIKECNGKVYLEGKDIFDNNIKLYFINQDKKNINLIDLISNFKIILNNNNILDPIIIDNIINNIINGNEPLLIKNALGKLNIYNCIISKNNIELLNKKSCLLNMDIKKKINNNFKSSTIHNLLYDNYHYDFSISINKNNNINTINRFFEIINNNIDLDKFNKSTFNIGIKELDFVKKLTMDSNDIYDIIELRNIARKTSYNNLLKDKFYELFYKLEEDSLILDQFIDLKSKLSSNPKDTIKSIKELINKYGLNNCPIFLNFKVKFNNNIKEDFIIFLNKNITSVLNFYYNTSKDEIKDLIAVKDGHKILFKKDFLNSLYLNNIVFSLLLPEDTDTFKITKLYSYNRYNKRLINNISSYGITSNIINNIEDYIEDKKGYRS